MAAAMGRAVLSRRLAPLITPTTNLATTMNPLLKQAPMAMSSQLVATRGFGANFRTNLQANPHTVLPGRGKEPAGYNDDDPPQGTAWYAIIFSGFFCFFYGHMYDTTRPTQVHLKIFGLNAPL